MCLRVPARQHGQRMEQEAGGVAGAGDAGNECPDLLKAAPGELWALGMAYAKGKAEEARTLRADIEKALVQ